MDQPFVLGVNYWPRRKAMYWWKDFEAQEVREEFALIRDLGMSKVRIFLLWEDFQPGPDQVSEQALNALELVCDIAAELGLGLDVTFFTGHMSGPNWAPGWLLDQGPQAVHWRQVVSGGRVVTSGYRNYFTDPVARAAQRLLLERVLGRLKDHPGIWVWNLGNEPDLFAVAPDRQTGRDWVQEMVGLIKSIDPHHPVTCGLHAASLFDARPLRVDDTFGLTDFGVMHGYPMYVPQLEDPLDVDFVPFITALTMALSGSPVLMEEFGGCTAAPGAESQVWKWQAYGEARSQFMASEEALASYIGVVLPRLVEVGALGAMIWCFADYEERLWDRPPCEESRHERFFGLVRPDGSIKPHAEVIRRFAASGPRVEAATRRVTLGISADEFYQAPPAHLLGLYQAFKQR